jgi:hypothetical protein
MNMTFLYLNSDTLGQGDPELGKRLLAKFLEELVASNVKVDLVGCVNAAVRLTTSPGPVLDSLKALAEGGARIASCGTCLDHFGLRGKLRVGEVGDLAGTVKVMATADRILRPC